MNQSKKITIVVSIEMYQKIYELSNKEDRSVNKQIIRMIDYYFENNVWHHDFPTSMHSTQNQWFQASNCKIAKNRPHIGKIIAISRFELS